MSLGQAEGLPALVQVGEPWWWVNADDSICLYDAHAKFLWPEHLPIRDVRQVDAGQRAALLVAGVVLSKATKRIIDAVALVCGPTTSHLLVYLPSVMRQDAPDLIHANLPVGWSSPSFDVLQVEDYEWVTAGLQEQRRRRIDAAIDRLGYAVGGCHYLSGFVANADRTSDWSAIVAAAARAKAEGYADVFLWALPQIFRDGLTIIEGDNDVEAFVDRDFPLDIGMQASTEPCYSNSVFTAESGFESRNIAWEQARLRFDVGPGLRSMEALHGLLHFYRSMRGSGLAFRFRDHADSSSAGMTGEPSPMDMVLGEGDGTTQVFPLVKRYGQGETRRITRPVPSSVKVAVDGVVSSDWVLGDLGIVEFDKPPAAGKIVTAGFLFDVPVRFEQDQLKVRGQSCLAGEISSVPLIEVREG